MATRKDYFMIAEAFAAARLKADTADHTQQWLADVEAIATALEIDNPNFDKEKFISACQA